MSVERSWPEPVAFGVLDLAAEEGGRHLVGLVADDEIPAAVRRLELLLHVLVAAELVQPAMTRLVSRNQLPVRAASSLSFVRSRRAGGSAGTARPATARPGCRGRRPGTAEVAAGDQLLDEEPGHDGLAGAGVVGQQEAQRLAGQHRLVDRRDLVRQRLDQRGVDGEQRVEEVGQADAVGLGDEAEQGPVAVEAPRPAGDGDLEGRLAVAVEQFVPEPAGRVLIGQLDRRRAVPLDVDDGHEAVGQDALHPGAGGSSSSLAIVVAGLWHLKRQVRLGSVSRRGPLPVRRRTSGG